MCFLNLSVGNTKPAITLILKLESSIGENSIILSHRYHYGERSVAKDHINQNVVVKTITLYIPIKL